MRAQHAQPCAQDVGAVVGCGPWPPQKCTMRPVLMVVVASVLPSLAVVFVVMGLVGLVWLVILVG